MDGPPPQEEDFTQIPLADRLSHKNWKARLSGYETLIKTFQKTSSDTDSAFKPYLTNPDILKKIAADSNAAAQEKGIEALVSFVKYSGETSAKTREIIMPTLVDKCFGSSRSGTRNLALELTLQYVEVENNGNGVVADILAGLGAKQPKVVAGCVLALKEIVRIFGTQVINLAPLLKSIPKIFTHTDKLVRSEGTILVRTLYQSIGTTVEPFLAELKPVQMKELHEIFEKMDSEGCGKGTLKPERYTRVRAREMEEGDIGAIDGSPEEEAPLDPRSMAEAVDIISKLPPGLLVSLASSKWKERKEALDDLATLLTSTLRIKDVAELLDVAKALASRMSDANINCVIVAATCLDALAKGLAGGFARFREVVVPPMLERLKERKQSVVDSIGSALDASFTTMTLSDILPDIMQALTNKNPQVKEGTMKFLTRCLSATTTPPAPALVKPLSETLAALLEDSFEGIRNEAAISLGTLMKIVGERPLNGVMEQLADVRKVKVKDAYEKASIQLKATGVNKPICKSMAPGKSTGLKESKTKNPELNMEPDESKAKSSTRLKSQKGVSIGDDDSVRSDKLGEKLPTNASTRLKTKMTSKGDGEKESTITSVKPAAKKAPVPVVTSNAKSKPVAPTAPTALDAYKFKHSAEDADVLAIDLIPTSIVADLSDSNWKVRLTSLDEMSTWIDGIVEGVDSEIIVRFLIKRGGNEKNFQVLTKLYTILGILVERCPTFGRSSVALIVPHLAEKLGDSKLKKPAGDTLLSLAEKTSLQFVLGNIYDPLAKQKAPKVLADSLGWIDQALMEFGVSGISLRNLMEFLKGALGNSNATVRTNATKTVVTVKLFVGSSVMDLLTELNPQLLASIHAEFDKCEGKSPPEPSRVSADLAGMDITKNSAKASVNDPMDDLFPRVEIENLLKGTTILIDAKSDAWKVRKEALETLQAILDQGPNKRLKPTMGEVAQILKARLGDTNKAVQLLALDIVARIAIGMGKSFDKHARLFVLPVSTVLADQKPNIRSAALTTFSAIAAACEGLDTMVSGISTALESTNPLQRSSLLNWLADWFKENQSSNSLDLSSWVGSIISSLEDRNTDIRKAGQAILPYIISQVGIDYVMQQTNSLKPASRTSVVPLLKAAAAAVSSNKLAIPTQTSSPTSPPTAVKPSKINEECSESPFISPPSPSSGTTKLPLSKVTGVRRKLPQGSIPRPESRSSVNDEVVPSRFSSKTGLKRPVSVITSTSRLTAGTPTASLSMPFTTSHQDAKKIRLTKDGARWIIESGPVRKDLVESLQNQMESHCSTEMLSLLFSRDHNAVNDHITGLGLICDFYAQLNSGDENNYSLSAEKRLAVGTANSDLVFKYASIRVHEPQPNVISKCLDVIEIVTTFYRLTNQQLSDLEALCFVPTIIFKLGDAREAVRLRVQQIIQGLPKVYAYSRIFQLLLEHGLKSKVAKTRQGSLEELASVMKRTGVSACDPSKSFPILASMISDKDAHVRKTALIALSEGYSLVGDKIWSFVGKISAKDRTQLEERLRRVNVASDVDTTDARADSPAITSRAGVPQRSLSPVVTTASNASRPASPQIAPSSSVVDSSSYSSQMNRYASNSQHILVPSSPVVSTKPRSFLPSRLGTHTRPGIPRPSQSSVTISQDKARTEQRQVLRELNGHSTPAVATDLSVKQHGTDETPEEVTITLTISRILSSDATRSVDALKTIQKILEINQEDGPQFQQYQDLSDHTQGLIETVTLQMGHVFEHASTITEAENFRLAKHLIQTINAFCDHPILAESLQAEILTALFEELTLRLLQTDENPNSKIKDLSRFINMILLRLFATCRRMAVIRALFSLLLRIVKPFPSNGTAADSKDAKVAELVLKCIWKLARNIPSDLEKQDLDPVELFPAIEHFLQSIPPNEWRARATNKVPSGDMPLRTIKVIIQHVVAHYGDDVYDLLSASFEDPSATIVYPYVFRILNTNRANADHQSSEANGNTIESRLSFTDNRTVSPQATSSRTSNEPRSPSPSHRTSRSFSSVNGPGHYMSPVQEPDPDEQLLTIINHISSETTGAMHKEGITELHQFLKAYPHKKPRVDRMLDSTGPAFRKYIARALASRAAEDEERNVAVADTLSRLESNQRIRQSSSPTAHSQTSSQSLRRSSNLSDTNHVDQDKLSRLHDLFQYRGSTASTSSSRTNNGLGPMEFKDT